jgi:hypothetical protein
MRNTAPKHPQAPPVVTPYSTPSLKTLHKLKEINHKKKKPYIVRLYLFEISGKCQLKDMSRV